MKRSNDKWLKEYNEERPHDAQGDMTPREFSTKPKPGNLYSGGPKFGTLTI